MGQALQGSDEKGKIPVTVLTNLFQQQPEIQTGDLNTEEPIPPITLEELKTACLRLGNKKAPGPDGIPNIALKKAISIAPDMFLHMYNSCLQEGKDPRTHVYENRDNS